MHDPMPSAGADLTRLADLPGSAVLSECRRYRYVLWRTWNPELPRVLFVGLNPSTADEAADDPTVRRCVGFAKAWGFGGVIIANLFAIRSKTPKTIKLTADPVGPDNDAWLALLDRAATLTVAAWGTNGTLHGRDQQVLRVLRSAHCIDRTTAGLPRHPLYAPGRLIPQPL